MDRTNRHAAWCVIATLIAAGSVLGGEASAPQAECGHNYAMHRHGCADGANCPAAEPLMAGAGPRGRWLARLEELGLTPQQRQSIQAIGERYRTRGVELAQRGSAMREKLVGIAPDDPAYATATEESAKAAADLAADGVRMLSEMRAEVHLILTDEQRQQLQERVSKERQRWDEWRSRHKPPQ